MIFGVKPIILCMQINILIIDNDDQDLNILESFFSRNHYFNIKSEHKIEDVESEYFKHTDLLILEVSTKNIYDLEKLSKIKKENPDIKTIIISNKSSEGLIIKCLRAGVLDFIKKPFDLQYLETRIIETKNHKEEKSISSLSALSPRLNRVEETLYQSESKSPVIKNIFSTLDKISKKDISCFLTGPSGSGKEYFARKIHEKSNRSHMPFISVNCPAIPHHLLESELFGHEKGSFTGAEKLKIGKFELANGGVLFLDELGDLPLESQVKLLRVLQEREIERVGGNEKIPFDVMLITATSKNLKQEISTDQFRADLYYRIAEIEIEIPSLKNRIEDLDILVDHFLLDYSKKHNEPKKVISKDVIDKLKSYAWPGNIRELRNFINKLNILVQDDSITLDNCTSIIQEKIELSVENTNVINNIIHFQPQDQQLDIKSNEKNVIHEALVQAKGNLTKAAKITGLSRSTLYRKIKKYDLKYSA